jgi:hypothetical protein
MANLKTFLKFTNLFSKKNKNQKLINKSLKALENIKNNILNLKDLEIENLDLIKKNLEIDIIDLQNAIYYNLIDDINK